MGPGKTSGRNGRRNRLLPFCVLVVVFDILNGGSGCKNVIRGPRNNAGGRVAADFRISKQRLVSILVDRGDGDEEAVARIETEHLRRDLPIAIAVGNDDALAIEVLVDGPRG